MIHEHCLEQLYKREYCIWGRHKPDGMALEVALKTETNGKICLKGTLAACGDH